jgi:hypothetical protein
MMAVYNRPSGKEKNLMAKAREMYHRVIGAVVSKTRKMFGSKFGGDRKNGVPSRRGTPIEDMLVAFDTENTSKR